MRGKGKREKSTLGPPGNTRTLGLHLIRKIRNLNNHCTYTIMQVLHVEMGPSSSASGLKHLWEEDADGKRRSTLI